MNAEIFVMIKHIILRKTRQTHQCSHYSHICFILLNRSIPITKIPKGRTIKYFQNVKLLLCLEKFKVQSDVVALLHIN